MTSFEEDYRGKVVYVTGGASGIGLALVEELRRCAALVHVADINADVPTDVSDPTSVRDSVVRALEEHGRIDVVFSNAGLLSAGDVEDIEIADFDRTVAVNLRGAFLVAKYTIPALRAANGGAMVFTGSTSSLTGARGQGAYCASKAGIVALVKVLADELAESGIRVNAVCPGWIETPFNDPVWRYAANREQTEKRLLANVPMRRQAAASEVVPTMLFLGSPSASYITGESVVVDGGLLAVR